MKKKYIAIGILVLIFVEAFRGLYYRLQLKQSYLDVIEYVEKNHRIDENLVLQLENQKINLEYKTHFDEIDIILSKKHIILFVIDTNITMKQKYIVSRLNN